MPKPAEDSVTTSVFFDGSCPLCRWEISLYQGAVPTSPIRWVDVSDTKQTAMAGCSCRELMARFHVQTKDGTMLSGAAAFVALWLLYPSWRWLGKLGSLPGMQALLELLYRGFLRLRPGIQWLVRQFATAKRW
ncbi:thiol-disulfide oxidoreductase DCC family protein [Janthinobacterium sp. LB3P118]|uniref:thiol-disulfide oxidoreductase DCC family protein n=1 Tax=Janthinobacterium sp. LB3P118 TaxID=3424195 RepID=UPI003F265C93